MERVSDEREGKSVRVMNKDGLARAAMKTFQVLNTVEKRAYVNCVLTAFVHVVIIRHCTTGRQDIARTCRVNAR